MPILAAASRRCSRGYAGRSSRGFSTHARADYKRSLDRYVLPFFEGYRLADVERADVRRLVAHLEKRKLSPASVVKNLTPLKAMFATALDDGLVPANPCTGLRVNRRRDEREEQPEAKAMTRAELATLLGEMPDRWILLFELLAKTGLRISEALGLDWADVQFGAKPTLRVRRQFYRGEVRQLKTHAGRSDLPLSHGLARALWVARRTRGRGPVFATRDGKRLADRNVRRVLDKAGEAAALEWVHFHSFRHTCASMLFDGGKNIRQVCDWLGHSDPAFTLRTYVHLIDSGLGEADFLDVALGAVPTPESVEAEGSPTAERGHVSA